MRKLPLASLLGIALTTAAHAQGLWARFGHLRAVEGEELVVRIELEDPSCAKDASGCLLNTVAAVEVELRELGKTAWALRPARPEGDGWWAATFTSTAIPAATGRERPPVLELRARVVGARGGTLAMLGDDEPLALEVATAPEARRLERILSLRRKDQPEEVELLGYVGTEGRVMSSARVRGWVGIGVRLTLRSELLVSVDVGPAFARPPGISGGPMTLGAELGGRFYTRDPSVSLWSLFFEPFGAVDLRFPGFDPGVGARVGVCFHVSGDIAVDAAAGGTLTVFRAAGDDLDPLVSASGSLRVVLRIGGRRD